MPQTGGRNGIELKLNSREDGFPAVCSKLRISMLCATLGSLFFELGGQPS